MLYLQRNAPKVIKKTHKQKKPHPTTKKPQNKNTKQPPKNPLIKQQPLSYRNLLKLSVLNVYIPLNGRPKPAFSFSHLELP